MKPPLLPHFNICRRCPFALLLPRNRSASCEVLWEQVINQGLVSFGERTDAVIERINATGEAFFTGTTWRGRRAMRVSVLNCQTTQADVDRAIEAVRRSL